MNTKKHTLGALALALLSGVGAQAAGAGSTFDVNADGWSVSDLPGTSSVSASWEAGVIRTDDQFAETSFRAPAKFLGNWSSLYGSTLSFDLTEVSIDSNGADYYTALIGSGDQVLYWYGGAPLPTFSTFVASLSAADTRWRLGGTGFNPASGAAPTEAQFQTILGNVTRLQINAEFKTGPDDSRLDNVLLGPVPEPASLVLLALGLGVVITRVSKTRTQRPSKG
ncbi:laminin B domain-containing protein [Paucibacter sp. Y2R2-4]|uniref:laminin B domain-containing protein n=1 Tax=Paucibacter sp. Y2R2-4 TaxID=2893553 RepID=UPI0021E4BE9E|nr:laminin B domain-containing protein [Paucibacter sp. Y2R2-4]MCV2351795.1 PEP-CTERM sorting domain-containing protein [Paucibacter sp. Y2R2-4]